MAVLLVGESVGQVRLAGSRPAIAGAQAADLLLEGLMDVVAANLDGVGDLLAVDTRTAR